MTGSQASRISFRAAIQTAPTINVGWFVQSGWRQPMGDDVRAGFDASQTPMLVAFSDGDPITGAMAPIFRRERVGAKSRSHPVIGDAGHFLQENGGGSLAGHIVEFLPARS